MLLLLLLLLLRKVQVLLLLLLLVVVDSYCWYVHQWYRACRRHHCQDPIRPHILHWVIIFCHFVVSLR